MADQPTADFCALLQEAYPGLRRQAIRLTRDFDQAEDLVQDCLERALRYESRFQMGTDLRAWLAVMMRNLYLNGYRRAQRSPMSSGLDIDALPDLYSLLPDTALGLDDLKQCLGRLPHAHREILMIMAFGNVMYEDIAVILDLPLGTVRSRLARARQALLKMVNAVGA